MSPIQHSNVTFCWFFIAVTCSLPHVLNLEFSQQLLLLFASIIALVETRQPVPPSGNTMRQKSVTGRKIRPSFVKQHSISCCLQLTGSRYLRSVSGGGSASSVGTRRHLHENRLLFKPWTRFSIPRPVTEILAVQNFFDSSLRSL